MQCSVALRLMLVVPVAACSGIKVKHIKSGDTSLTGVPWNLAMTKYSLAITRQITKCDAKDQNVEGTVDVTVTASKALDNEQRYLLDASGWWATSDIAATLATDGTSLGLNAHSEDATGTVI